jgi:ureidoglycolate lyase
MKNLVLQPLTAAAFAPFGDVVHSADRESFAINSGLAQRFHDLARLDPGPGGRVIASIVRSQPCVLPQVIRMLERHPLGSQAFIPLQGQSFAVVVARAGTVPAGGVEAFLAVAGQGVNYARGVWHHPLITLDAPADFLVLDRDGEGVNCDEHPLPEPLLLVRPT